MSTVIKASAATTNEVTNLTHANAMHKLKEANAKYKHLLKLAKERIQAQEEELDLLRTSAGSSSLACRTDAALSLPLAVTDRSQGLLSACLEIITLDYDAYPPVHLIDESNSFGTAPLVCSVVKVCQRIQMEDSHNRFVEQDDSHIKGSWEEHLSTQSTTIPTHNHHSMDNDNDSNSVHWALIEYELTLSDGVDGTALAPWLQTLTQQSHSPQSYRFHRWKRFRSNQLFMDHIRRDRGEPIGVPHFSLTPLQAAQITTDAKQQVEKMMEEYRKFRVKAEISRKQAEETIRLLQQNQTQHRFTAVATAAATATNESSLPTHHCDHELQLTRVQNEWMQQEIQWKKQYEDLMLENHKLKSSASEGLIASQWRHRYEQVCKERDDWKSQWEVLQVQSSSPTRLGPSSNDTRSTDPIGKEDDYESKYRDLKESFRLYRKKAKEIFDAQQRGDTMVRSFFYLLYVCLGRHFSLIHLSIYW
jgi:hypothetical protein